MSDTIKIPPEEIESLWQQPDFDASQAKDSKENAKKFEIWPDTIPLYETTHNKTPDMLTGTTKIRAEFFEHKHILIQKFIRS